ncbi:MAG: DNA translocase FtsK [Planctomycetota bacterium]|nr:DNA translocase FtsK [Planctomycetota bacterium]MDP6941968.1 DNA translocase FtsK [Planctomycetota bacterium]
MAKSRRKTTSRKRKSKPRNSATSQVGFVAAGVRAVFGWVATLVMTVVSIGQWAIRRLMNGLGGEKARIPLGMTLAAASVFTFAALVDFKTGATTDNICGTIGYQLANLMLTFFGIGAFLPPAFGAFWGIARMVRENESNAPIKAVGVLTLSFTVSAIASGFSPSALPDASFPMGRGGWIGHTVFPPLAASLGAFGVSVLLTLLGAVSSLLATEWAFVPLIKELLRKGGEGLRQQTLPLKGENQKIRAQAEANKEKAAKGLSRLWEVLLGTSRPYHPGQDAEGAPQATPANQTDAPSSIPSNLSSPSLPGSGEETPSPVEEIPVVDDPPQTKTEKAVEVEPDATPSDSKVVPDDGFELPGISDGPEMGHRPSIPDQPKPRRRSKPKLESLPPITILAEGRHVDRSKMQAEIDSLGQRLQSCFDAFGLDARVVGAERGPTLTLFEVQLAHGVSVKKLKNQRDDMAVQLGSHGVRIVYPLPGRTTVGIEVPNLNRESVFLKDVFVDSNTKKPALPMVIGRDTLGKPVVEDLTAMPHMLVAGTTGSGKSVCLNSILMTMLLTRGPDHLRLILVDPKQVELQLYKDIPHLACPVVTDMKRAPFVLDWAVRNMEDRLHLFKLAGVRNIADYNALGKAKLKERLGEDYDPEEISEMLPYIVLVVDELADLMMVSAKEVEIAISRLAAKARAAGIHLLVATQRPSTDVVTGLIKMNLPVRIAFKVTSGIDSRVILDDSGADMLLGNGDFLYRPPGAAGMTRGQGAFVGEEEVRAACDHLREHGTPEFIQDLVQMKAGNNQGGEVDDPLYEDAVRIILQSGRGSASLLQRALSIGYTRASRLIDIMSEQGVLGPFIGSKAREVQMTVEEWEVQLAEKANA